jgi:hypothetical protein
VFAHTVVLAAFLVTLPSIAGWRRPFQALWGVGLAVTLAPGVASDPLLYPAAVLPFLGGVALGWRVAALRLDAAAIAAGACLAGVVGGWLLEALAEHNEIVYNEGAFEMASAGRVLSNTGLLLENVALLAHGKFATGEVPIDVFNAARELVAVGAVVAVVIFGFVAARAARPVLADAARPAEQRLLAIYWAASIVAVSLAFIVVTAPVGTNAVRFVTTLWPALLTLAAIVYGRRATTGLALLATGCAILGCVELARGLYTPGTGAPPDEREAELVESFAAENDLDHGYAGYWDAAPISVQSGFDVRAYPIEPCGPKVDTYCPFHSHQLEAWYQPAEGVRTFYVVNGNPLDPATEAPPTEWGPPIRTAQLGDLTVYAYDYDIASRFQHLEPGALPEPVPGTE